MSIPFEEGGIAPLHVNVRVIVFPKKNLNTFGVENCRPWRHVISYILDVLVKVSRRDINFS